MNKKKLIIGIILAVIIYHIFALGLKLDETGFHGLIQYGDSFINLF
ncbi:Uncharacterised protein [uncultured Clostridium sp.]|nr:Uncharacterised protein [uncultured Clostridium sp.]SCI87701.1 Uncharacterised protein [uncultured Clostridium sp.]